MTFEEFVEEKKLLLMQNSFTHEEIWRKNDWLRSSNETLHHIFTLNFSCVKPSIIVDISHDEYNKDVLVINYNSILFFYSPSGNNSITSKNYTQEIKIDKFKNDIFEKWLNSQISIKNNFLMCEKKKTIEKEIKKINKDFK